MSARRQLLRRWAPAIGVLVLVMLGGALGARWMAEQVRGVQETAARLEAIARVAVGADHRESDPLSSARRAGQAIGELRDRVETLRPAAEPLSGLAGRLSGLPLLGQPAAQLAVLWEFADAVTALGESLAVSSEMLLGAREQGLGPGFIAVQPELSGWLAAADRQLTRAEAARDRLDPAIWPTNQFSGHLAVWDVRAPLLRQGLSLGTWYADVLAHALGRDGPRTYLVLAQTHDELRATGGFISSVGTVRLEGGRVVEARFEKVYAAERPPGESDGPRRYIVPPRPISRYLGVGEWRLRDANWWADFPASARQAAAFWRTEQGESVDGVIAFEERGLEAVLAAVGPVLLADGQRIGAENVKQVALEAVFSAGDQPATWYASQSMFSQELATALLASVERLPADRLAPAAAGLRQAAERRELLFWSADPRTAQALRELGLDGAVLGEQDDYLYPVESNVGYSKLSQHLRQNLEYTVELDHDGRPIRSVLTILATNTFTPSLQHASYPSGYYSGARWNPAERRLDQRQGYYGGFTRVLLPGTATVQAVSGFDDGLVVAKEGERTVVGGYSGLAMGEQQRIRLEWQPNLAPRQPGQYRLLVQRQPGAPDRRLVVRVLLPPGARLSEATPGAERDGRFVIWRTSLDRDRHFVLSLAFDQPPDPAEP